MFYFFNFAGVSLDTVNYYARLAEAPGQVQCTVCKQLFLEHQIQQHLVMNHVDTLYLYLKKPNVTQPQFRKVCETILCSEAGELPDGVAVSFRVKMKCPYCGLSYWNSASLKVHLAVVHISCLEDKIEHAQVTQYAVKRVVYGPSSKRKLENKGNEACEVPAVKRFAFAKKSTGGIAKKSGERLADSIAEPAKEANVQVKVEREREEHFETDVVGSTPEVV